MSAHPSGKGNFAGGAAVITRSLIPSAISALPLSISPPAFLSLSARFPNLSEPFFRSSKPCLKRTIYLIRALCHPGLFAGRVFHRQIRCGFGGVLSIRRKFSSSSGMLANSFVFMRDDLQEALIPVKWAETHIQVLQERFLSWQRGYPYEFIVEIDPQSPEWELFTPKLTRPLDPLIAGDIGAIINSLRSALDLLLSAVIRGHGKEPDKDTYFPIRTKADDFLRAVEALELKYGLSRAEIVTFKDSRAYEGSDSCFFLLNKLDILRKHHRLISAEIRVHRKDSIMLGTYHVPVEEMLKNPTALFRLPKGQFRPTQGNTSIAAEIFLNETTLLKPKKPAVGVLREFAKWVGDFFATFPP